MNAVLTHKTPKCSQGSPSATSKEIVNQLGRGSGRGGRRPTLCRIGWCFGSELLSCKNKSAESTCSTRLRFRRLYGHHLRFGFQLQSAHARASSGAKPRSPHLCARIHRTPSAGWRVSVRPRSLHARFWFRIRAPSPSVRSGEAAEKTYGFPK